MRTFVCKLLIVALLVPYNVYGANSIENLVDKKIEISMSTPAPLPSVPVGALKLMLKALKEVGTELPYKKLSELLNVSTKALREMSNEKMLGKTLIQDARLLNIKVAKNIDLESFGLRVMELSNTFGDEVFEEYQNVKELYKLTANPVKFEKAKTILKKEPTINFEELVGKINSEIVANSDKKIDLGFVINQKPIKQENIVANSINMVKKINELEAMLKYCFYGRKKLILQITELKNNLANNFKNFVESTEFKKYTTYKQNLNEKIFKEILENDDVKKLITHSFIDSKNTEEYMKGIEKIIEIFVKYHNISSPRINIVNKPKNKFLAIINVNQILEINAHYLLNGDNKIAKTILHELTHLLQIEMTYPDVSKEIIDNVSDKVIRMFELNRNYYVNGADDVKLYKNNLVEMDATETEKHFEKFIKTNETSKIEKTTKQLSKKESIELKILGKGVVAENIDVPPEILKKINKIKTGGGLADNPEWDRSFPEEYINKLFKNSIGEGPNKYLFRGVFLYTKHPNFENNLYTIMTEGHIVGKGVYENTFYSTFVTPAITASSVDMTADPKIWSFDIGKYRDDIISVITIHNFTIEKITQYDAWGLQYVNKEGSDQLETIATYVYMKDSKKFELISEKIVSRDKSNPEMK